LVNPLLLSLFTIQLPINPAAPVTTVYVMIFAFSDTKVRELEKISVKGKI
jgi:hypothetical protein